MGQAELGADDMHDALPRAAHGVELDTELLAIARQRLHLRGRDRVRHRLVDADRRDVVVHGRQREIRTPDPAARHPQALERLWRRHLVHQVQVDVEQVGLATLPAHDVPLPHLLRKGPAAGVHDASPHAVDGLRLTFRDANIAIWTV